MCLDIFSKTSNERRGREFAEASHPTALYVRVKSANRGRDAPYRTDRPERKQTLINCGAMQRTVVHIPWVPFPVQLTGPGASGTNYDETDYGYL